MLSNTVVSMRRSPVVCGVSSLGLDHQSLLGRTLDRIAWQKSGIFKVNRYTCFSYLFQLHFSCFKILTFCFNIAWSTCCDGRATGSGDAGPERTSGRETGFSTICYQCSSACFNQILNTFCVICFSVL